MVFAMALAAPSFAWVPAPAPQVDYCPRSSYVVPRPRVVYRSYVVRRHFRRDDGRVVIARRARFERFGRR